MKNFSLTDFPEFNDHEIVAFGADRATGLKSVIAIHNTNLGPAAGGTRYWHYRSERDGIRDALRLSRAMTYKCALARVPHGGGKGVIIGNARHPRAKQFFSAYAKRINLLRGSFYTGEDVGLTKEYLQILEKKSPYIIGRERIAGNPSPWAALGVFHAMLAAVETLFGSADIAGRSVAIKGVGKVGAALAELIYKRGGKIIFADINAERVRAIKRKYPKAEVVAPSEIHKQRVDVYAPCALGDEFDKKTIPQLKCAAVCGGANNQLTSPEDGERLHSWGILYIPDYLANAGGLINVVAELDRRGYSRRRVERKVRGIRATAKKIIGLSKRLDKPTSIVADKLAENIFLRRKA